MVDRSKALVTRGALERVLARAAELQTAAGDPADSTETLTEAQVIELGKEVGLSPEHLLQALAEERAHIEPIAVNESGVSYQLFGRAVAATQRVVPGTPERVLATLDRWMQKDEWLQVVRQRPDRIMWEPRRGIFGGLRRLLGSRDYALSRASDIAATAVPVDESHTLVRLQADFSGLRRAVASQTGFFTVTGSAATGVALLLGVMVPVAIAPAVAFSTLSFYSARRAQQHAVQRGLLALEQVLDRLERGDRQNPSLLRMIESALPPPR